CDSSAVICKGQTRIDLNRLSEVCEGSVNISILLAGVAAIAVVFGVARVQNDHLIEIKNGSCEVTFVDSDVPPVGISLSMKRINPDDPVKVSDCSFEVFAGPTYDTAIVVWLREARVY